jgi:Flp pilus assembly protein TadG
MMMHGEGKRPRRNEKGASAVEFALVLPLLVLLLFGIISYGVMLSFRQSLSQAAAEGARAAAVTFVENEKQDEAVGAVDAALDSFGVSCSAGNLLKGVTDVGSCTVTLPGACTPAAATGVKCVTVTLTYDYRDHPVVPSFPGVGYVMPSQLTYSAQARVS